MLLGQQDGVPFHKGELKSSGEAGSPFLKCFPSKWLRFFKSFGFGHLKNALMGHDSFQNAGRGRRQGSGRVKKKQQTRHPPRGLTCTFLFFDLAF